MNGPQKNRTLLPWVSALAATVLAALLLSSALMLSPRPARAVEAGMAVTTDRFVYGPGDVINFSILIDSGGQSLNGDLVLRVYPPASPASADPFASGPIAEKKIVEGFSVTGAATAAGGATVRDLNLGTGGYPARVVMVNGGRELLMGGVWIAVADPGARAPVDLVLLWTVGGPPQRDPMNDFADASLVDRCRNEPRTPDTIFQHESLARDYPVIRTTYAIEPLLLDQLLDIADGFQLAGGDGGGAITYEVNSLEAVQAASCVESLKQLATFENVEMLSTPYVFANLPLLAKQGWGDGTGQYRLGHDVLTETLMLPEVPRGAYVPQLDLTTDSLRYVASTGGEYAVLGGYVRPSVQGRDVGGALTFRLRDLSGERLTSLFASDDVSAALLGDSPDPNAFFAGLANAYAAGSPLVIAAASSPSPPISAELRAQVYLELSRQSWLNSITLAEAKDRYRPDSEPATLLRYLDPASGYITRVYYARMDEVHELFEDYRATVDPEEPQMVHLAKLMYTAENSYWFSEDADPAAANSGLAYLDEIERYAGAELEGLKVELDTPLLQRSSSGTALVTVTNDNTYAFTVDLAVSADEEVEFPDGPGRQLRVEGGVTQVVEIPYRSNGWTSLEAQVLSRDHVLVADSAGVHPLTIRVWVTILVLLALLAGGAAYYFLVIKRG